MNCSECNFLFHVGACSGVTEETFNSKRDSYKKAWKCDACKGVTQKAKAEDEKQTFERDLAQKLAQIEAKLDCLLELPKKIEELEKSVQHMSDKFDEFQSRLLKQENLTKELVKRVDVLENTESSKEIAQLRTAVDNLEWRSRRPNIEIHGIPETEKENLLEKVNELALKLKIPPVTDHDIAALHRLPAKPGKTPGVIMRFVNQSLRDSWLAKRHALKEVEDKCFFCENITHYSRALLATTKEWAQRNGYAYAWHSNGKVLLRKRSGEPSIVIRGQEDLAKLGML